MICLQLTKEQWKGDLERGFVLDKNHHEIKINLDKAQFLCCRDDKFFVSGLYIQGERVRVESPVGILYQVELLDALYLLKAH